MLILHDAAPESYLQTLLNKTNKQTLEHSSSGIWSMAQSIAELK